jgi:transcriptional regulator of heat shock response
VKFSIEERKILEELRYKRNKIEHFHINETVSSLISLSSSVLNLLLRILNENIELNKISPYSKELINQLPKELSGFNVFVNERMRTIKSEFEKKKSEGTRNFLCPSCAQQTFFIDSSLSCLFCNYTNQLEIIASELELVSPEIIEKDGNKCEKCKTLSVIKIEKKQVCLNCITKENNLVIED